MLAESLTSLAAGVVFGFALAAPPGPMNAIIAEESVLRGWIAGFRTGLGAMTADVVFFLLALVGVVGVVDRVPSVRAALVTVGGVVMLAFAYDSARSFDTAFADEPTGESGRGFVKALVLGLTNPYQLLFWLTVGVALLDPGRIDLLVQTPYAGDALAGVLVVETGSVWLLGGLFAGIVVWIVGFPAALVGARERVDALSAVVAVASALVLAVFGLVFLWDGLSGLW